ncbi:hypothetical protein CC80DRAFT_95356 [Byssothecium circinans]|uniref:Mid2 domain-containing protein n=1 Tax=Byssothecium circinans TaxID=147558 RepID=A0A6A5UD76_9PLEO|nr:hypothetical protein CC80DRAFT_95356 [Byssothecium circinans]
MAMRLLNLLAVATSLAGLATAGLPALSMRTYNAPGMLDADTHAAIARDLEAASLEKRKDLKGNTTLDRSWNGAVLLKFGASQKIDTNDKKNASSAGASQSVEIVCTTCYIKGLATAELSIPDNFNATNALNKTVSSVSEKVVNFTETIHDYVDEYFAGVARKFGDGIDRADFAFPQLNYSFAMEIPPIPEVMLNFGFDGMELYLQTNTILGAALTYELNLYTSNTPIGVGIGKDTKLGIVFKVDLLLAAEGAIDINTGLHLKLDAVKLDIPLFSDKVSNIEFKGAQFEFLPVTVESAGVVLKAVLRIGIHAGIAITAPSTPELQIFNASIGANEIKGGIEVGVFAHIAEFITNVTAAPGDKECQLKVVQDYQLALGAAAGASVALGEQTWGPVAATEIPIFNTQMASICAVQGKKTAPATVTASPTSTSKGKRQQDMTTRITETKITHTGVQCISSIAAGNCPMSLQQTTKSVETRTLTASAPRGTTPTFPPSVSDTVTSTVAFGKNVVKMSATSGSPTSYVPPPPTNSAGGGRGGEDVKAALEGEVGGVKKKVVVGVSVGLGIPLIVGIVAAVVIMRKRKSKYAAIAREHSLVNQPYAGSSNTKFEPFRPEAKKADVSVSEMRY